MNAFFSTPKRVAVAIVASLLIVTARDCPAQDNLPFSPDAKVTLSTDRGEYLLGENVLINYILENTGKKPFQASFGGDYQGSDRSLRFKVNVRGESGKEIPPSTSNMCFGGVLGTVTVAPGEKLFHSLPLLRYCQIDQPGTYTITVWHDLGWKEGAQKAPTGEMTLRFRMPTPDEAEAVVQRMEQQSNDQAGGMLTGNKAPLPDFADFRCFRYLVYLQPLLTRAKTGDDRALEGVGSIPFPEATSALIDLANGPDPKHGLEAAQMLGRRLPDPSLEGKIQARGLFDAVAIADNRSLEERSWNPKFADQIRALSLKFLARTDPEEVAVGGGVFQTVATPADSPAIFKALELALDPTMTPRRDPKGDTLDFPLAVRELLRATQVLYTRGYRDNDNPSGNAQILAYIQHWVSDKPDRPEHFADTLVNFAIDNNRYPLRELALKAVPQPMPDAYIPVITRGLADRDYGVLREACETAGKSGRKEFLKPILEIIETENEEWLMRSAMSNALKLGGGLEALNDCADKLVDEDLTDIALDSLDSIISKPPGGSSGCTDLSRTERLALRDAWKSFLRQHATEIRAGKKFKLGEPPLTAALFGRARSFDLPNGKSWPPVEN